MKHIALLLAAGQGNRLDASLPKQFVEVDGEPIVLHTMRAFDCHPLITDIYVVCTPGWEETVTGMALGVSKFRRSVTGGEQVMDSLRKGIAALAENEPEESLVLVHDAVRPLITQGIITRSIEVCAAHGNAITALPSHEAFLCTDDGETSDRFIPRHQLMRAQTPHTFPLSTLNDMMQDATRCGIRQTQSLYTLANELHRTPLHIALGDLLNFKITVAEDLRLYRALKDQELF